MIGVTNVVGALGLLTMLAACSTPRAHAREGIVAGDSALLDERAERLKALLHHPDSANLDAPIAKWELPLALREISGLALTGNSRLLTHGDERGKVFEVDYRRGVVLKSFTLGEPPVHGDFESIAMAGDTVMMLTSDGILYRFGEGKNGASVKYESEDTGLGEKCEFESMAYEEKTRTLLMACKRVHVKELKGSLIIYRWPLGEAADSGDSKGKQRKVDYLSVPIARISGSNGWTTLHPSDMTINPFDGNYVLIASEEKALFEITPAGAVVFARPLPPGHDQPEGVAITRDSVLIISDEAKGGSALITLYRWRM